MIKEYKDIAGDIEETVDVCVIGTGAGGAVVAADLAEKGLRVAVLEEGSRFTIKNFNQDPADMMAMMYRDDGFTVTLGLPPVSLPLGKAVGGTTIINSATCFRTPKPVVEKWADRYDCAGLSYDTLAPYFDGVEKAISVVELSEDVLGKNYQIVRRGAKKLGIETKPLKHNVKGCEGAGVCQWGCVKQAKQSTDLAYIPRADKAGARIYANCRAKRIVTEAGRVVGVKGRVVNPANGRETGSFFIRARIVCAAMGSMITPAFLLKNRLANVSGQVGRNLTIHPCGRVVAEMDEVVNGHHGVSQGGFIDAFADEGIMLEGIFIPPGVMGLALPGMGQKHKALARAYNNIAAFGVMVSDTTRGRILPGLPGYAYTAWYSLNQADAETLRKGVGILADIFFAAGARRVFTGCFKLPEITGKQELERFKTMPIRPWHFELMAFHPLGTCRMGNNPRSAVVNLNLESHDVKGLFITDGSVFPSSLGVNPQVTIMAFAARAADYIAAHAGRY
ncbi:GMC family oxidoreductase N-terminal domain-containing protein [Desulfosudis oleivorans]|uniref:Glucose-methanol-choline oxidoreductase n=1 Tax=Desulfosudis oleivorans (strain DSM 6200 / JCM 39069 / Hxd3) TaxID=96561 RepID=A8ZWJ6_DESOH|nr:GMC family oxidoreductase [Desulfosudis oleivorans]ABW66804.1 glucose-methanol-choline oxidoreductase [Desulfosudis oleivorans Hxd3]